MCELSVKWELLFAAWTILEYWLGKTDLVKSGSTLEFLFSIINSVIESLRPKRDGK